MLAIAKEVIWGGRIYYDQLPIGGVTVYGKGRIVIIPAFQNDSILLDENIPEEYKNKYQNEVAAYIADVIRGVAIVHDPEGKLKNEITSRGEFFGLSWQNEDNSISVKTVFDRLGQPFSSQILKNGEKILGYPATK